MIPYRDENPTVLTPVVTVGVILLNVLVWVLIEGMGSAEPLARSVCQLGLFPGEMLGRVPAGTVVSLGPDLQCVLTGERHWWTVFSSMFMHGGWLHLIGNMWFLWLFGNNIEDAMGHSRYVFFYLLCGTAAAATQVLLDRHSLLPMIGASGAISGVLGGYLLLYPRVRVHTLIFLGFFVTSVALPAYVMLGYWILLQLVSGAFGLEGGVAVWAHVGGFVTGLLLIRVFVRPDLLARRPVPVSDLPSWS